METLEKVIYEFFCYALEEIGSLCARTKDSVLFLTGKTQKDSSGFDQVKVI